MPPADRVELETLLDPLHHAGEYDIDLEDLEDIEECSDRSGPIFHTKRPPNVLQYSLERLAIRCTKGTAHLATRYSPRRTSWRTVLFLCLEVPLVLVVVFLALTPVLLPSYSHPPAHYDVLRRRVEDASYLGRANINNEKVFIAASIYDVDGQLAAGAWGRRVKELVDVLGPQNVFLSIYEDNAGPIAQHALNWLSQSITCNKSMVVESLDTSTLPNVTLADGKPRVTRIGFLAEVRNRALLPLDESDTIFDKILYLNDVIFDPIDAANLLFSTNVDAGGKAQYRAACAVDFMANAFKFYDTYATRDLEGNAVGVIVYPWFTSAGAAQSRQDVFDQKDAVRVRSCWGGMVAFEAKWFQQQKPSSSNTSGTSNNSSSSSTIPQPPTDASAPSSTKALRFRAETELYWDASECCLIHADLAQMQPTNNANDTGIYMNPYVRVAYSETTHRFIPLARHFERLLSPVQQQLNHLAQKPGYNPRRLDRAGHSATQTIWTPDEREGEGEGEGGNQGWRDVRVPGRYVDTTRTAPPGGFCGGRKLSVLGDDEDRMEGKPRWWGEPVPFDPSSLLDPGAV